VVNTYRRLLMTNPPRADISDHAGPQMILNAIRKRCPRIALLLADDADDRTEFMDKTASRSIDPNPASRSCAGAGQASAPSPMAVARVLR
jgi:hypothetical protein